MTARKRANQPRTGVVIDVALDTVFDELASFTPSERAGDDLDAFGRRGAQLPVFSAAAMAELLGYHQSVLAVRARGEQLSAASAARADQVAEWVVGSVFRLVREEVFGAARRMGMAPGAVMAAAPELLSVAYEQVLVAASRFDLSRGESFATYALAVVKPQVVAALGVIRHGESEDVPLVWRRVARVAKGVAADLSQQLGREPSYDEVRDATRRRFLERSATIGTDLGAEGVEELDDASRETSEQETLSAAASGEARLRRSGVLAAIDTHFAEVLGATRTVSLDAEVAGTDGVRVVDRLGALTAVDDSDEDFADVEGPLGMLAQLLPSSTQRLRKALWLRLGEQLTYAAATEQLEVDAAELRAAEKQMRARLQAPHAHWTLLGPTPGFDPDEELVESADENAKIIAALRG